MKKEAYLPLDILKKNYSALPKSLGTDGDVS